MIWNLVTRPYNHFYFILLPTRTHSCSNLRIRVCRKKSFSFFSTKTYVLGAKKRRFVWAPKHMSKSMGKKAFLRSKKLFTWNYGLNFLAYPDYLYQLHNDTHFDDLHDPKQADRSYFGSVSVRSIFVRFGPNIVVKAYVLIQSFNIDTKSEMDIFICK